MLDYLNLATRILSGGELTHGQALEVLSGSDLQFPSLFQAVSAIRMHHHGKRVQVQILSNAKSGFCPEDCHYCSQSAVSTAQINRHPLKTMDKLFADAVQARALNARRFCMGLSGRTPSDCEIDALCALIRRIVAEVGIDICCSIGFLKPQQARCLREAGLDRVNHNLNTSARYYPQICTTHTYEDRIENLRVCRQAGLDVCSGGIVGQGETEEDIVDMLMALKPIQPRSIPINFLIPVPGTPFADMKHNLTPMRCLRVLALARLLHPAVDIRVAGGREYHLRTLQPLSLFIANSIFSNGYLTESGQSHDEVVRMITDLGFEMEVEGAAQS